jgi:cytochrome d ubiquinol oxidase subunit I
MFVLGVSSWYLLKKRDQQLAVKSILVAAVFGLLSALMTAYTGDASAKTLARVQPVKFASMEALVDGKSNAGLIAFGILKEGDRKLGGRVMDEFVFRIEIPGMLSILTGGDKDVYVPGLADHFAGNPDRSIMAVEEKMERGKIARDALIEFQDARKLGNVQAADSLKELFTSEGFRNEYFRYFGYSSVNRPEEVIPNVKISFYSFHLMVMLGFLFILIFAVALYLLFRGKLLTSRWFLLTALFSIPLPYVASELGWVLAEVGRQPWIIQDLMTVSGAVTKIVTGSVITTFILFAMLFSLLLVADVSIILRQIKNGPKH